MMTKKGLRCAEPRTRGWPMVDTRRVLAGMALVVIGMQLFIIQPGVVSLLVAGGMDQSIVGYAASAELFGIAFATILGASIGTRLSWRALTGAALLLMAVANLGSAVGTSDHLFLILRLVAGLGSGLAISIGYAMVGAAADPDRSFGHLIIAVLVYGALGVFGLPAIGAWLGAQGVFALFALMAAAGLPLIGLVVQPAPAPEETAAPVLATPSGPPLLLLAAVFLFFLGQGVVWAFLSLIGEKMGIAPQAVANGLTIAQLAGSSGSNIWSLHVQIGALVTTPFPEGYRYVGAGRGRAWQCGWLHCAADRDRGGRSAEADRRDRRRQG